MSTDRPYSRIYYEVMDDPKFDGIREDVRHFGSWSLMLVLADMAWPSPAFVPTIVPRSSLSVLTNCGLVDVLTGGRFRIHGLDAERNARRNAGAYAAAMRWHRNGNAETMPRLDETRQVLDKNGKSLDGGPFPPLGSRVSPAKPLRKDG